MRAASPQERAGSATAGKSGSRNGSMHVESMHGLTSSSRRSQMELIAPYWCSFRLVVRASITVAAIE